MIDKCKCTEIGRKYGYYCNFCVDFHWVQSLSWALKGDEE